MRASAYISKLIGRPGSFLLLLVLAIGVRYYLPALISDLFFVGLLIAYFRSEDEPFWLAFMLALTDGVFSFFGYFEACLTAIPGLPDIEVTQFYILLALVKAWKLPAEGRMFYTPALIPVLVYLGFLILQGYAVGISMELNMQLRSVRTILPLALVFALPRLMRTEEDYIAFFRYCFLIALLAFATQVFALTMRQTPTAFFGLLDPGENGLFMAGDTYRGLYSVSALLISTFGALYFIARQNDAFRPGYLYLILLANLGSAFLSATRGWVICFLMAIGLFFLFVAGFRIGQLVKLVAMAGILIFLATLSPFLNRQVTNSFERMLTLESLVKGDMTADGTLVRVHKRSPIIMEKWRKSPLTGWGFSNYYYKHEDHHVGNQNILFHSGVIGALLLAVFFAYFCLKLWGASRLMEDRNPFKTALLVFPTFFIAWFFLHSTSFQNFGYGAPPGWAIAQAVFFSMGGMVYCRAWETANEAKRKAEEQRRAGLKAPYHQQIYI